MSHLIQPTVSSSKVLVTLICAIFSTLMFFTTAQASQAADGTQLFVQCWEYSAAADPAIQSASDGTSMFFVTGNSELQAVDVRSGVKLWSSELGGGVVSNILVTDSGVIVATNSTESAGATRGKTTLRSISKQTGVTVWATEVPSTTGGYLEALNGSAVLVGSEGRVIAIDQADGTTKWDLVTGGKVTTQPYSDKDSLIFGNENKEVVRISASGAITVAARTKLVPSAAIFGSDRFLVGDERGNVISISSDGSPQWKFKNGARISSILPYLSEYIATSFDNFVYKLSRGGNVVWKRRLTGRVAGRPLILGDKAVVSVVGLGSVYVIDLKRGKISDRFESGEESSAGIASTSADGFAITSSRGLRYYSRSGCTNKKGDVESTSPGKKS